MCMFKAPTPVPPVIQYVGPTDEQIAQQNAALETFKDTLTTNNQTFQDNLQASIDAANAQSATLLEQITEMQEQTAAAGGVGGGGGDAYSSAPYALTTEEGAGNTDLAQTTEAITKKKKPKGSLKIAQGSITQAAGAGVNYGV